MKNALLIAVAAALGFTWTTFVMRTFVQNDSRAFLAEKIANQIPGEVRAIRCDDFPQAVPTISGRTEYFRCDRDGQQMTFKFFDSLDDSWNYAPVHLITRWDIPTHREEILYKSTD